MIRRDGLWSTQTQRKAVAARRVNRARQSCRQAVGTCRSGRCDGSRPSQTRRRRRGAIETQQQETDHQQQRRKPGSAQQNPDRQRQKSERRRKGRHDMCPLPSQKSDPIDRAGTTNFDNPGIGGRTERRFPSSLSRCRQTAWSPSFSPSFSSSGSLISSAPAYPLRKRGQRHTSDGKIRPFCSVQVIEPVAAQRKLCKWPAIERVTTAIFVETHPRKHLTLPPE